jgi:hypothetical protein
MGVQGTTLCWKFLDGGLLIPATFAQLFEATKTTAVRGGVTYSPNAFDPPALTEKDIENRMEKVREQSVKHTTKTLPSFGSGMMLNGESWQLRCFLTVIPHIKASVIEHKPKAPLETVYRHQLVRELIQQGVVDCGAVESHQLFGKTWDLYFFLKIHRLRPLREASILQPFRDQMIFVPPDRIFPKLRGRLPALSLVAGDKRGFQVFLDKCNEVLTQELSPEELARYLQIVSVSPKKFLRA